MYQLTQANRDDKITSVARNDGWHIPFDLDNIDYRRFKNNIASGATLNDAEGNPMTADQISQFLSTLP